MILRSKRLLLPIVVSIIFVSAGPLWSEERPSQPTSEQLRQELEKIQAEIAALEQSMLKKMGELRERRHALEYNDPAISAIRNELVELERQVLRKREALDAHIAANPEIKKIEDERRAVFQELKKLKETEAAIRRELALREDG